MADQKSLRPPERTATDIARELRERFTRRLFEITGSQAQPDPVLGAVFHALAVQIDRVYQEADQVFFAAALDDLIRGIGMPARLARPAQAVVQFSQVDARESVSPEVELIGYRQNGEQIVFTPDAAVDVAPIELVFAAAAEGGRLTTMSGSRLPWSNTPILPGMSSPVDAAHAAPFILLAFDVDEQHLSRIGLFAETAGPNTTIAATLARSPWQLLDGSGRVTERGVLRSSLTRGGMRRLSFFDADLPADPGSEVSRVLPLVGGVHGGSLWILPDIPRDRRWTSRPPAAVAAAVSKLLPQGQEQALDRPLAWLQIPLPAGTKGVLNQLNRFAVNCVTASNIEVWNEQIQFDRMGSVVSHRPLGSMERHVMGVLSVIGEAGAPYLEVAELDAPPGSGRFRYRGDARFEFVPARQQSGRFDSYAMLRLLYCDGDNGNGIPPGEIKQVRSELARNPIIRVASLTPAQGGAAPPAYADARDRFAELLRTRERVVTSADIEIAVRATEPRVKRVGVDAASEITGAGLGLVTQVVVVVDPDDFADPDADLARLGTELERYLGERCMIGQRIVVAIERERASR